MRKQLLPESDIIEFEGNKIEVTKMGIQKANQENKLQQGMLADDYLRNLQRRMMKSFK